jgi:hypothetical protein
MRKGIIAIGNDHSTSIPSGRNAQKAVSRESGEWVIVKTFGQMKTLEN